MKRLLVLGLVLLFAPAANAAFSDDFEGYANTAAMMAPGAWGDDGGAGGVLDGLNGNPGSSMAHPGGPTANHVIAPLVPTDANPIVWEFDFYDDGTSANKRITGGLRDNGAGASLNGIIEHGMYNSFAGGGGYGVRVLWVYGSPNWVQYPNVSVTQGWHSMKAVLGDTTATFTIDLMDDGTIDDTLVFTGASASLAWNVLRLGGPSGLSSAGGGANFDNVSIQIVPEPATLALLGMGGLALIRRRR